MKDVRDLAQAPDFLCSIKIGLGLGLNFSGAFSQGIESDMSLIKVALGTGAIYTSITQIPASSVIYLAMLDVKIAYPVGTTIDLGIPGTVDKFMSQSQNIPTNVGTYILGECISINSLTNLVGTIGGSPGFGQADMVIIYSLALP